MPRFIDSWVVDRTLFEYANGGNCACCGPMNLFLPQGVESTINSISDIDTDAAQQEVNALQNSPWPPEMRDDVWSSRLRLRMKLKQDKSDYTDFWNVYGEEFSEWMRFTLPAKQLKKILQVPRREITSLVAEKYNVHSKAFGAVLCAITEQVANFSATGYPDDGIGEAEVGFESLLKFDRRGGFTLPIVTKTKDSDDKTITTINEETLQILLNRIQSLGEGKLLDRKASTTTTRNEEGGADEAEIPEENAATPSFRSDRRIVRLLIARYWADALRNKYLKYKQEQQQEENENAVEQDGDTATSKED